MLFRSIGLFPKTAVSFSLTSAHFLVAIQPAPHAAETVLQPILLLTKAFLAFFMVLMALVLYRKFLARRAPERRAQTWACGYASVSPRMQYTASSFAEPILRFFRSATSFKVHLVRSGNYFPKKLELSSNVTDAPEHFIFRPVYVALRRFSKALLKLQSGHIPQYLFYILLAVVALLLWKFPW